MWLSFEDDEGMGGWVGGLEWCNVGAWRIEAQKDCFQVLFNGDGI